MTTELASLIERRKEIDQEFKIREQQMNEFRIECQEAAQKIEIQLAQQCKHEYIRDNYMYAPLYCKTCYLEKDQIGHLSRMAINT